MISHRLDTVEMWRGIALFLLGVVLSMSTFYVAEFRRAITRADAVELIDQLRPGTPWAQDRGRVYEALDNLQRDHDAMLTRAEFQQWVLMHEASQHPPNGKKGQ